MRITKFISIVVVFAAAVTLLCAQTTPQAAAKKSTQVKTAVESFARTPILEGGRIKPIDTLARTTLLRFGGKTQTSIVTDSKKEKLSAAQWLYKLTQGDDSANDSAVFRIDHPELKTLIGGSEDKKHYSYRELLDVMPSLARAASNVSPESKDPYDLQVTALTKNILYYYELKSTLGEILNSSHNKNLTDSNPSHTSNSSGSILYVAPESLNNWQKFRLHFEYFYNQISPLLWAQVFYALAFILLLTAKRNWGVALIIAALVIHLFGIGARMLIQERPPVTNLYSSALFVGAAAVIGGLIIEKTLRNRLGAIFGAIVGFATLQISDKLAQSGDTLEMMRAVLDSNFWLSTHVVVVTIGYSAMFVAGGIAFMALVQALVTSFTKTREPQNVSQKTLDVIYGVNCAALLFSFIGTMLGGIWADQSWGRFWGWDPKENGALMIVLWSALVIHARMAGWARKQGLLMFSIGGNIITAWSWFGTNLLGVGLHSYGFTDSGALALWVFVILNTAAMAAALFVNIDTKPKSA